MKRLGVLLCISAAVLLLSGCWDYRGMDDLTIVTGIAVDRDPVSGGYRLMIEAVDINSVEQETSGSSPLFIEAEGRTLREALNDARKRLYGQLFFSNMQVLIVSRQIAETEGIAQVVDFFLNDIDIREALDVVISGENSAAALLQGALLDHNLMSFQLEHIIQSYQKSVAYSVSSNLYQAFDSLQAPGKHLLLPYFQLREHQESKIAEVRGLAYFSSDRLAGLLERDEVYAHFMITGSPTDLLLTMPAIESETGYLAFYLFRCDGSQSVRYENGKLTLSVALQMEASPETVSGSDAELDALTTRLEAHTTRSVTRLINQMQAKQQDMLGFASTLYKSDYPLWKQLEPQWSRLFAEAEVEISVNCTLRFSGIMREE